MNPIVEKEIKEAMEAEIRGWDFSWLKDKIINNRTSWNYRKLVEHAIKNSSSMLDMGTGGGEFLASLKLLPQYTAATESFRPNLVIAKENLNPKEIEIFFFEDDSTLPFPNEHFDLIINRHESYNENELYRILKPDGFFITQQVGEADNIQLNHFFDDHSRDMNKWNMKNAAKRLKNIGFTILKKQEDFLPCTFKTLSSIIYYLKIVPWQIPDFDLNVSQIKRKIKDLYHNIQRENGFKTLEHRFLIVAKK